MKPGDLVSIREGSAPKLRGDLYLYGGEDIPWDPFDFKMIPTDIPCNDGDLGIILRTAVDPVDKHRVFHKILTDRGVGWVRELWLKVME